MMMAKKDSKKKQDKQQDEVAEISGADTAEESAATDDEAEVAGDEVQQRIEQLEQQLAEAKDMRLRAVAELDNFKRRTVKEKCELSGHVKVGVFRDIIGAVDDFERFFQHMENDRDKLDESFVQGVELIHKSLRKALDKHGVKPINETGVPVDYSLHEGVMTQPVDDEKQDQTVIEILEVGYRIDEREIRPAKVKIGVFGG
jgi:molecular chaperone GrpE